MKEYFQCKLNVWCIEKNDPMRALCYYKSFRLFTETKWFCEVINSYAIKPR